LAPITRSERVDARKDDIFARYDGKLQAFLDFVLGQYVKQGVGELDQDKLGALLQLKYHSVAGVRQPRRRTGYQRHVY
jgi:type I restriction enzyme R subunit